MRTRSLTSYIVLIVIAVIIGVVLGGWLLQVVWAWVVPDVFRLLVKAELLPATITFWQAVKLSFLSVILFGASHSGSSSK